MSLVSYSGSECPLPHGRGSARRKIKRFYVLSECFSGDVRIENAAIEIHELAVEFLGEEASAEALLLLLEEADGDAGAFRGADEVADPLVVVAVPFVVVEAAFAFGSAHHPHAAAGNGEHGQVQ